jgi:hypothetical protein
MQEHANGSAADTVSAEVAAAHAGYVMASGSCMGIHHSGATDISMLDLGLMRVACTTRVVSMSTQASRCTVGQCGG